MSVNVKTEEGLLMVAGKPYDGSYVTPEMFGAKGDGTTDDTLSLQECINSAITSQMIIKLRPTTYKITGTLNITDGCKIKGYQSSDFWSTHADENRSIILAATGSGAALNISKTTSWNNNPAERVSGVEITDIHIKGFGTDNHGAIYCQCYNTKFENVKITNFGIGVHCTSVYKTDFINVNIFTCYLGYAFRSNGPDVVIKGGWVQYKGNISEVVSLPTEVYNSLMNKGIYRNAVTGMILFDSKVTMYDFAIEALNYGLQVSAESTVIAHNLNIEKITEVGIYSNYNYDQYKMTNVVYIDGLNLWGFPEGSRYFRAVANALYQIRLDAEQCKLLERSNTFGNYYAVNGARYVVSDAHGDKIYGDYLPEKALINGGEIINRSHFTKNGFYVDVTMNRVDATYDGPRFYFMFPIPKKIKEDYTLDYDYTQYLDCTAFDVTTGKSLTVRLRSDYELSYFNETNNDWAYIPKSMLKNLEFRIQGEIRLLTNI